MNSIIEINLEVPQQLRRFFIEEINEESNLIRDALLRLKDQIEHKNTDFIYLSQSVLSEALCNKLSS